MAKSFTPGLGVDIWLSNVIRYSKLVSETPFAKEVMDPIDLATLHRIHKQAADIYDRYRPSTGDND